MPDMRLSEFAKEVTSSTVEMKELFSEDEHNEFLYKRDNRWIITEKGQSAVFDQLENPQEKLPVEEENSSTNEEILVATIQKTIQAKDQQIDKLQALLAKQQTLLDQQQLNAEDKKVIRELNDAPKLAVSNPDPLAIETQQQVVEKDTEIQQLKQEIDKLEAINAEWVAGYKKLKTSYQQLQEKKKKWFWKKNS